MAGPLAAPPIKLPYNQPMVDPKTGLITREWIDAFNALTGRIVQGPLIGTATDGGAALFDGTSGRLLKG